MDRLLINSREKFSYIISFFLLSIFLSSTILCGYAASEDQANRGGEVFIRVQVIPRSTEIVITGSTEGVDLVFTRSGAGPATLNGREEYLPYNVKPAENLLRANGDPFRGSLSVVETVGGVMLINTIPLEHYIAGIINNEISSSWHPDAIKAQAVIARSYAMWRIKERAGELYHVTATNLDQVYTGAGAEDTKAVKGVQDTYGEVLTYDGEIALTLYHSNAGGKTEAAGNVWGGVYHYLRSVSSAGDKKAPHYSWKFKVNESTLRSAFTRSGYDVGEIKRISVKKKSPTGRVKLALVISKGAQTVKITGEELRKVVGYGNVKSTLFKVSKSGSTFIFKGRGSGHGVGLSQWGAKAMAEKGRSYKKILKHYYPGTKLDKIY